MNRLARATAFIHSPGLPFWCRGKTKIGCCWSRCFEMTGSCLGYVGSYECWWYNLCLHQAPVSLSLPLTHYDTNCSWTQNCLFFLRSREFFFLFLQKLLVKEFPLTSTEGETSVYQIVLTSGPFLLTHHSAEGSQSAASGTAEWRMKGWHRPANRWGGALASPRCTDVMVTLLLRCRLCCQ